MNIENMDTTKLEIKAKIKELEHIAKERSETYKEELSIRDILTFIDEVYLASGYKNNVDYPKNTVLQKIYLMLKNYLSDEYDRLNRIDNPYFYVPEEWLTMSGEEIIRTINKRWQKELPDGRIEQTAWVGYTTNSSDKTYNVHQYVGNKISHDYSVKGDVGDTLKDCVLYFWESRCKRIAEINSFWD